MRRRPLLAALVLSWASACDPSYEPAADARELPPPPAPVDGADDWARHVAPAESSAARTPAPQVRKAALDDRGEDSDQPVVVRRLVYRVSFVVPPGFRDPRAQLSAPAGELQVDLSLTRLRARFLGPGWPVPEGSEVRLRIDGHGVYLFDGQGGRPLGSGQLASWFEGRTGGRSRSSVRIRREYGASTSAENDAPAELMCALLAEWTNQPREALVRRCSGGSLPPGFRFGPWSAELTAVVPLELPRRALRADEVDPPAPIANLRGAATLDPSGLARVAPLRPDPMAEGAERASLTVHNQTNTRAVVIAQGVPVGWVDADATLHIEGFAPGTYRVGAVRPLGILRMRPRRLELPAAITMDTRRRARPAAPVDEPDAPGAPKEDAAEEPSAARTDEQH